MLGFLDEESTTIKKGDGHRVRVNQRLYFPLSATDFPFLLPQCYVSLFTSRWGGGGKQKVR
jgi:hypothetical protein